MSKSFIAEIFYTVVSNNKNYSQQSLYNLSYWLIISILNAGSASLTISFDFSFP